MSFGGVCCSGVLNRQSMGEVRWDGDKGVLSGGGIVSRGCPCPGRVCMLLSSP